MFGTVRNPAPVPVPVPVPAPAPALAPRTEAAPLNQPTLALTRRSLRRIRWRPASRPSSASAGAGTGADPRPRQNQAHARHLGEGKTPTPPMAAVERTSASSAENGGKKTGCERLTSPRPRCWTSWTVSSSTSTTPLTAGHGRADSSRGRRPGTVWSRRGTLGARGPATGPASPRR